MIYDYVLALLVDLLRFDGPCSVSSLSDEDSKPVGRFFLGFAGASRPIRGDLGGVSGVLPALFSLSSSLSSMADRVFGRLGSLSESVSDITPFLAAIARSVNIDSW